MKYYQDGINIIDNPKFFDDLLTYLESTKPLSSCYHCLGNVGKLFKHEQTNRKVWRLAQQYTTEEMIDMEYLTMLKKEPDANELYVRSHCTID